MGLSTIFQKTADAVSSPFRQGFQLMQNFATASGSYIHNFLNRAFSGYGSALRDDLQRQAYETLASSGLDSETISRKIDNKQVHVSAVFDSSNWTGSNFTGFKKPEAHVTIDEDQRPIKYMPRGPQP